MKQQYAITEMGAAQAAANRLYTLIVAHGHQALVAVSWQEGVGVWVSCPDSLWPTVEALAKEVGIIPG